MKTSTLTRSRVLTIAAMASAMAFTQVSSAKDHDDGHGKGKDHKQPPGQAKHDGGANPAQQQVAAQQRAASQQRASTANSGSQQRDRRQDAGAPQRAANAEVAARAQRAEVSSAQQRAAFAQQGDRRVAVSEPRVDRRAYYSSQPRSSFSVTLGDGYRGRGYYYGPANSPYYYEGSDVRYYRTRDLVPSEYFGSRYSHRGSTDVAVQRALSERGYYRGPLDGDIGPGSRHAIARYQDEHGMRPTGQIDGELLRSLHLD